MTNKLEQDKAIIAGAPEGATEIDDTGRYWLYEGEGDFLLWHDELWIESWSPFHTRSLADIEALIAKDKRIAGLEKVLTKLNRIGGLGLDKHKWIEEVLKGV